MMDLTSDTDVLGLMQGIVRSELRKLRFPELAVVTRLLEHASDSDEHNYACDVKLRNTGLELPAVPIATGRIGHSALPNENDLVLVEFLAGDLHGAVITGRLYNEEDRPPVAAAREWVYESPDDAESGVRRVFVKLPNDNVLTVDDDQVVLECGGTTVTIENGGNVSIEGAKDISLKADGAISLESGGDMTLSAGGKLEMKAQADSNWEGLNLTAKSQASAKLEGGAMTTIKGPMIALAGLTDFSPA
jgi:phage baseplate assembly protein gpV